MKALISKQENDHGDTTTVGITDVKDDTPDDKEIGLGRRTQVSTKKMQIHRKKIEDIKRAIDNMEQLDLEATEMLQNLT